jgi:hypothetical protein
VCEERKWLCRAFECNVIYVAFMLVNVVVVTSCLSFDLCLTKRVFTTFYSLPLSNILAHIANHAL